MVGVEVESHAFVNSAVDGCDWSVVRTGSGGPHTRSGFCNAEASNACTMKGTTVLWSSNQQCETETE
jgi:hypothetical protein